MELIDFPPFYTLQLNPATRAKQFEAWSSVLRTSLPGFVINIDEQDDPVFINKKISRSLSTEGKIELCSYLKDHALGYWLTPDSKFLFYRIPVEDWATAIHTWADKSGKINSIESVFSVINGDESKGEVFHGIPSEIALNAFRALEGRGKCELTFREPNDMMSCGVKFFS